LWERIAEQLARLDNQLSPEDREKVKAALVKKIGKPPTKEKCRRGLEAVIEGLFYVRRHTGADGSFEWYVLNGHTRRRASKFFPTRAAAAAERAKLQVKLELAKEQVLRRTPKGPL
jgi:hypothetical protein